MVDDFIGRIFLTRKGGELTIVGSNGLKGNKKRYTCTCSRCSKDEKLWPLGSIYCDKYNLQRGCNPCGCSSSHKYTRVQNFIRMCRLCEGTTYTVIADANKEGKYTLSCSVCDKDQELWPLGSIKALLEVMRIGTKPCGCSTSPKYNEQQNLILCKRRAAELGKVEFLGWGEDYKAQNTRVKLKCLDTNCGVVSTSVSISVFLSGSGGCPTCGNNTLGNATRKNWVGLSHTTNLGGRCKIIKVLSGSLIEVECNLCKKDPEMYGSGRFIGNKNDWRDGSSFCGCSSFYSNTPEQNIIRLRRRPLEINRNLRFVNYSEPYKGVATHILQECLADKGHPNWSTGSLSGALAGSGCPQCAREANQWGLYEDRVEEDDNLYLILFISFDKRESFIKVGRAFDVKKRMRDYLKYYNIEIIKVVKDTHFNVRSLEKHIHKTLHTFHYRPIVYFGGSVLECFKMEALKEPIIKSTFSQ